MVTALLAASEKLPIFAFAYRNIIKIAEGKQHGKADHQFL